MDDEKKLALLGFHATTWNYYVPSFFHWGKEKSLKLVEKYSHFMTMFANLGNSWEAFEGLKLLEEFACHLYRGKGKSVDELRYKKFESIYCTKNKIQDLSLLPQTTSSSFETS